MPEKDSSSPAHKILSSRSTGSDWSILEKLAGKYDSKERARVDRTKSDIEENPWDAVYHKGVPYDTTRVDT